MRRPLLVLVITLVSAVVAGGASADGPLGPSPGVSFGWDGVLGPRGTFRYVALPSGRTTLVAVVNTRSGRVARWSSIRGGYGVPLVAQDGSAGGMSADGRTLVLASFVTPDRRSQSRFPVLSVGTLRTRTVVSLPGLWSYDAISPDASTLFLVEYLSTTQNAPYRVRAYDLTTKRLIPEAIVDRLEEEAVMRGRPATRATSQNGRWAYTLYARPRQEPFVHALDTVRRQAFCIDLPLELGLARQMSLRLRVASSGKLMVRTGGRTIAVVDTDTFQVRKS
jgi:hypothetical protein